uniref:Uncharacterized protein n=1 Tax=Arundo donax TaxID=35708 RepID=A0A0A9FWA6_ARUDO
MYSCFWRAFSLPQECYEIVFKYNIFHFFIHCAVYLF